MALSTFTGQTDNAHKEGSNEQAQNDIFTGFIDYRWIALSFTELHWF